MLIRCREVDYAFLWTVGTFLRGVVKHWLMKVRDKSTKGEYAGGFTMMYNISICFKEFVGMNTAVYVVAVLIRRS